ncbi:Tubulin-like protein [Rubripirellula tenax]|uniref:Tubulin-like protein n=1 Tax=Rubripirellula tenax TaxID=2528015 RepID=A0A5C6EG06_9BACT|nr:tubulin-like doman-containing protein [Rubripirellula tenax]TWU48713.1 Tubulin-like protein [Rubripirellula tenax]
MEMQTTNSTKICEGYEPIPGYVLEEAIGRGGFGEVWRSSAPGGLKKAIKFVFGSQDQSRASRELRSLERVKSVHHPFLLTLERFEIVDDQLVIITELADGSLEDVYKVHRDRGSCGIPRDLLLSHLHDTADGLDYLHQSYQLQHLDIKPGNLLMIGGHVKVADFGLLKDLRDIDCSVVGGLTPIYAPPEVFDGRPSLHSDQYSLAVMFQELLTGTRPFSGRTIAQLATQHVHSAPNLETLPPSDRPVVARALEKNPNRRFPSCKEFVDALRNQSMRSQSKVTTVAPTDSTLEEANGDVEDLPQLNGESAKPAGIAVSHAMVIGLGGSGAECVRELRRRIADLHVASPLHLNSVVIDTDMATIHALRLGEVSDRVPKCHTIHTPLKSAHEYRTNGTDRLRSISRRWIYNVPRNGTTEGMRPLGRLALVDHGETVKKRLIAAIETMIEEADGAPARVYVVGSLAGGTGSGMYIDVVHLLRHLLDQAGLEETRILSLLSSVGFQIDHCNPLALHDAQAALHEIEFFMQVGNGYPGDEGAGFPSVPAARTPLRDLYVIAGTQADRWTVNPIETITEYLWADSTGCGDLLSAARKFEKTDATTIRRPSIRSVGVVPLGDRHRLETRVLSPAVVRELLVRWLGIPSKARREAPALADRLERRLSVSIEHAIEAVQDHLDMRSLPEPTIEAIETFVRDHANDFDWLSAGWLNNAFREVSVCLNDRRADVSTVYETLKIFYERCVEWSRSTLQSTPRPVGSSSDLIDQDLFRDAIVKGLASKQLDHFAIHLKFLEERIERFAAILAVGIVETKNEMGDLNPWESMPELLRAKFGSIVSQLHRSAVGECLVRPLNDLGANVDCRSIIAQLTQQAVPIVIDAVERHSDEVARTNAKGIEVAEAVAESSTTNISQTNAQASLNRTANTHEFTMAREARKSAGPMSVDDGIALVKPALLSIGGLQRLILVVGSEGERSQLETEVRAIHPGALTVAVVPNAEPKLIHEAQKIELKNILSRLTVLNGSNEQVTTRLASRVDVAF